MRRFICLLLVLACLCSSLHSQDLQFKHIDWGKLDDSLTMLEWNLQQLKTDNTNLQQYSEEIAKFSANQALQLQESEARYESSEKVMRRWRLSCIVISTIAISEGLIIYCLVRR